MSEKFTVIDMNNWKRSAHCEMFRNYVVPKYDIGLELDISAFYRKVKEKNWSFTLAFIYTVAKCANEIEEFRYRFQDGGVVLYHQIHTSFTYLPKGAELFKVVPVEMQDNIDDYIKIALETIDKQSSFFVRPSWPDVFHFSAVPWVSYIHVSHAYNGDKNNSAPMFDWGKFYYKQDKLIMPFSIQAHHSFVDGIHIGRFVERLQEYLNGF